MIYTIIAVILFIVSAFLFIRNKLRRKDLYIFLGTGIIAIIFFSVFTSGPGAGYLIILLGIFSPIISRTKLRSPITPNSRLIMIDGIWPEDFNSEFLKQKRIGMDTIKYKDWLKKQYTSLGSNVMGLKELGSPISQALIDVLKLLENESEGIAKQTGEPVFSGKKISEDFLEYKNIK